MDPQGEPVTLDGLSFSLYSIFFSLLSLSNRNNSGLKILGWVDGLIPQLGPVFMRLSPMVLSPRCQVFCLMSSPVAPGSLLNPGHLGLSGVPPVTPYIFLFILLTSCFPSPYLILPLLPYPSYRVPLPSAFPDYFLPPYKWD